MKDNLIDKEIKFPMALSQLVELPVVRRLFLTWAALRCFPIVNVLSHVQQRVDEDARLCD